MSPLRNTPKKKMSPRTQIVDLGPPAGTVEVCLCQTESKELDKTDLPLSAAAPMALLYDDLTQEVYDSFVSSCLLSKTIACLSKRTVRPQSSCEEKAANADSPDYITASSSFFFFFLFFRGWGQSVATQENTTASSTQCLLK